MSADNGEVKWDKAKKAQRDLDRDKDKVLTQIKQLWDKWKLKIRGSINMNWEQLEAELVGFHQEVDQLIMRTVPGELEKYREFTAELVGEARRRVVAEMTPPADLAEHIMDANVLTVRNPDGSQGEMIGFESTDALLCSAPVQNCNDMDLVGFCMHGSILCAVYEGSLKAPVKMIGQIKYPEKVRLPALAELAQRLERKGLAFPDLPKE